jgi:hypothetical protein
MEISKMTKTNYSLDIINCGGGQQETLFLGGIHTGNNFKKDQDDRCLRCTGKENELNSEVQGEERKK